MMKGSIQLPLKMSRGEKIVHVIEKHCKFWKWNLCRAPRKKIFGTNKDNVKNIVGAWSMDVLDMEDYGLKFL